MDFIKKAAPQRDFVVNFFNAMVDLQKFNLSVCLDMKDKAESLIYDIGDISRDSGESFDLPAIGYEEALVPFVQIAAVFNQVLPNLEDGFSDLSESLSELSSRNRDFINLCRIISLRDSLARLVALRFDELNINDSLFSKKMKCLSHVEASHINLSSEDQRKAIDSMVNSVRRILLNTALLFTDTHRPRTKAYHLLEIDDFEKALKKPLLISPSSRNYEYKFFKNYSVDTKLNYYDFLRNLGKATGKNFSVAEIESAVR